MRIPHLIAAVAVGAIALAACGGGGGSYSSAGSPPAAASAGATTTGASVHTGHTALGDVLVDANGMTLYGLTKDVNGVSTCEGACATVWPALTVASSTLPAGLDAKLFSITTRADGSHQLKAGKWPPYRYSGDSAPGNTNGQGTGGVWFAVTPTGGLHKG